MTDAIVVKDKSKPTRVREEGQRHAIRRNHGVSELQYTLFTPQAQGGGRERYQEGALEFLRGRRGR